MPSMRIRHRPRPRRPRWPLQEQGQGRSRETKRQARRLAKGQAPQTEDTNSTITFVSRTMSIDHAVAAPNTRDNRFFDSLDAKDIYYLNDPTGELEMAEKVPSAFQKAGYKVRTWAKFASHPVWLFRGLRESAPRFADDAQFVAHVIEVLKSAGVRARKADVTIDRRGDTIRVWFLWPVAVRAWRYDEELGWAPDPLAS
jgi:hypothetical protein